VLVIVDLVSDVTVIPMDVVHVIPVGHDRVPAIVGVHVHVPGMREVRLRTGHRLLVHMVSVDAVSVAIVQVVHMIPVLHRCVSAA
jgi:hypothetical protein